jgi:predicted transcriptional regulator of viral defense system
VPKRLPGSLPAIVEYFENSVEHVYTLKDLNTILAQNRSNWEIPRNTTRTKFVEFLLERTKLHKVVLSSGTYPHIERYSWGEVTLYLLGLSLKRNSYLSHGTAIFLHGLTEQIPKMVYVNHEQTVKPKPIGHLTQEGLNRAFTNKQRRSNYIFRNDDWQFVLINGKQTAQLGVVSMPSSLGETLRLTSLERTLIDIVVRPEYSGGPYQILQAYKSAKSRMSINVLMATLKKLDYMYPFHQAIGFFMERAGYEAERLDRLRKMPMEYDFYLAHAMREKNYDPSWRLYFPKGFE